MQKETFTVREAAFLLGSHPETIRRAIRRGALKGARVGLREIRISRADLEAYYREQGGGSLFREDSRKKEADERSHEEFLR